MLMEIGCELVTQHRCPSGLRSRTQDAMWQHSRVQIPLCAFFTFTLQTLIQSLIFLHQIPFQRYPFRYGNIHYLAARAFNTYYQSYFLYILMHSLNESPTKTQQNLQSLKNRLIDHLSPCFKQHGMNLLGSDISIVQQWRTREQQIYQNINEFFDDEAKSKAHNQRGASSNQNIKNNSPNKEQLQPSLSDSFLTITKEIMSTKIIIDLQSKHDQMKSKLRIAEANQQQYQKKIQYLTQQLNAKSNELQAKQQQNRSKTTQLKDLSQKQRRSEEQFILFKVELQQLYKKHHRELQEAVSKRQKAQNQSATQRLNAQISKLSMTNSDKIKDYELKISDLQEKLRNSQADNNAIKDERDQLLSDLSTSSQQSLRHQDQLKQYKQKESKQNRDKYRKEIEVWRQEQKKQINAQMKAWCQKMKEETQEPLKRQILKLNSSLQESIKNEQQLKNIRIKFANCEKSLSDKYSTIQSLQQNLQHLKEQIENKQNLIKKIAQLILKNTGKISDDNVYKKIQEKLQSLHQDQKDLQQLLNQEIGKYDNIFQELLNLKADIRNINTTLLQADNITIQKLDKIKTFTCKNQSHIHLLSKYYERVQNILKKNIELYQLQQQTKSKMKNIQNDLKVLSDQYQRKKKQLSDLQSSYDSLFRKVTQNQRNSNKQIQDEKSKAQAQKNQFDAELSVKQQLLQKINKELSEAKRTSTQKENQIQNLLRSQKGIKSQVQRLNSSYSTAQITINKLKQQNKQVQSQLLQLQNVQRLQVNNLQQAVIQATDNNQAKSITSFDALLRFLLANKPTSKSGPFSFSSILQNLNKEQQKLQQQVKKFLQIPQLIITSSYRFDEFNKNFSNYLPIKSSFPFILIVRSKKGQIFGAISTGVIKSQIACIFNLNSGKTFQSNKEMNSTVFDSGYLIFGQGEVRIKNNSNLEASVNSKIFNTRCFSFKRDEIVGPNQDGDSIELTNLQIHRIEK